jgi:hypothetical protein
MPGFMDFMSGNSDLMNKLKQGGYTGGNMGQPLPTNTGGVGVTSPTNFGGRLGPDMGMPGGNMPNPMGGVPGQNLPPGMNAPPPGLTGPPGMNLPGGPMGGGGMNPMRRVTNRPPNPGVNPTNAGGGRDLTAGPLGARPPMDMNVPPNMRRGGVEGANRPGQTPRARTNRGGGISMF